MSRSREGALRPTRVSAGAPHSSRGSASWGFPSRLVVATVCLVGARFVAELVGWVAELVGGASGASSRGAV